MTVTYRRAGRFTSVRAIVLVPGDHGVDGREHSHLPADRWGRVLAPVSVQVNGVPLVLCLPTEKIVGTHITKIINPKLHLLCFPVTRTPHKPVVFDQNQFGTAKIHLGNTVALCLPSHKQVLPPPPAG